MDRDTDNSGIAAGHAALAICESLLLALVEQKVVSRRDTLGILQDASVIHRDDRNPEPQAIANRQLAARLIDRIIGTLGALPRT